MKMSGRNNKNITEEELRKYEEGWTREMVNFWRERMLKLEIYRTGALYKSLTSSINGNTIEHKFLTYGIYVAAGVGNGYKRDNGGDLPFLKDWKANNKHRKKRDWFTRKYYSSVMKLGEVEASHYGEAYRGLIATALQDIFEDKGIASNL